MISGYPIFTGFCGLTGCQQYPRDSGLHIKSMQKCSLFATCPKKYMRIFHTKGEDYLKSNYKFDINFFVIVL